MTPLMEEISKPKRPPPGRHQPQLGWKELESHTDGGESANGVDIMHLIGFDVEVEIEVEIERPHGDVPVEFINASA